MNINDFQTLLFERAKATGFSEYEMYYAEGDGFEVSLFEREIDNYQVTGNVGVCFRGLYEGHMGYASAEIIDETSVEMLVNSAKQNAQVLESKDVEEIYGGGGEYVTLPLYSDKLQGWQAADKIAAAQKLEECLFAKDSHVISDGVSVSTDRSSRRIVNSKGLDVTYASNRCYFMVEAIVEKDGQKNNAYDYEGYRDQDAVQAETLVENAVEEALAFIGAKPVDSGKYAVILSNTVATSMLAAFDGIFSAEEVQKGRSLLADKLGTEIAATHVTLLDDPHSEKGMASRPFDAEGVPTRTKTVIENGMLKTFLHNIKTARKDGVEPTGNAAKGSIASPVSISGYNLHFAPGGDSLEELMAKMGEGLYITSLQGMHSGTNAVSGDFSVGAKGFVVTGGKKDRAVEQITIAGNFFTLLREIVAVGCDLRFRGTCGSPSLWIKEVSVAGS